MQPELSVEEKVFCAEQKAAYEAAIPIPALDLGTDPTVPPSGGEQEGVRVEPLRRATPPPNADDVGRTQLRAFEDNYLLYSDHAIRIPAKSRAEVYLALPHAARKRQGASIVVDRLPHRPGLENASLVECACETISADSRVRVVIWNRSDRTTTVPAHSPVAVVYVEYMIHEKAALLASNSRYESLSPEERTLVDTVKLDPEKQPTPAQLTRVRDVLAKHVSVFAADPKDPGKTHLIEVQLPLKPDANPHRHAPAKLGEAGRALVELHVAEIEARDIIRKSNSSWGSRVVLVSKKDGTTRFCIDYRDLNSKLQFLDSPLPLTAEAIDRLSAGEGDPDSLLLCTLDLASGF